MWVGVVENASENRLLKKFIAARSNYRKIMLEYFLSGFPAASA
jgi:hypothetical protein